MKLIFSTNKEAPKKREISWYAHFYKKHNFKSVFDSNISWGPLSLEIHCNVNPFLGKLTVESGYYLSIDGEELPEKELMEKDNLEMLCNVFDLTLKAPK